MCTLSVWFADVLFLCYQEGRIVTVDSGTTVPGNFWSRSPRHTLPTTVTYPAWVTVRAWGDGAGSRGCYWQHVPSSISTPSRFLVSQGYTESSSIVFRDTQGELAAWISPQLILLTLTVTQNWVWNVCEVSDLYKSGLSHAVAIWT